MRNPAIGVAGYMGSGKSTCAAYLGQKLDAEIIDADSVGKQVIQTEPEIRWMLAQSFGERIFDNREVSFSTLGEQVFTDEEKLQRLNAIVHPFLVDRIWELLRDGADKTVVLDAALISYWRIEQLFDILIWVDASEEVRLNRIKQKTTLSREQVLNRMRLQQSLFARPVDSQWHFLMNDTSAQHLHAEIEKLIGSYGIEQGARHGIG